jgi:two-component system cell cycle sensor histidine kinase/response regulator CckA
LLNILADSPLLAMTFWDLSGRVLWANREFLRLTGYSMADLQGGLSWDRITPPEWIDADQAAMQEMLSGQSGTAYEKEFFACDGRRVPVMVRSALLPPPVRRGVTVIFDLRARKHVETLELQMLQMQKLDAIGRLAGGVAHDFNNLLMIILSNTQLTQELLPPGSPGRHNLDEVITACDRAADLTQQLLAFGRRQLQRVEELELRPVVEEAIDFARQVIGEGIDLNYLDKGGSGRIRADRSHITQIIINLCLNARDALDKGGRIEVTLGHCNLREEDRRRRPMPAGVYSLLEVRDNGKGMETAVLERLFEPFFTTKEMGKGRGLGLAAVYGIVKQNGGFIFADSQPGHGSVFSIYFPEMLRPEEVAGAGVGQLADGETILLVEDEAPLRQAIERYLTARGFHVLQAADGTEAIALVAKEHVDLLLSDVIMPRMGGIDLAQKIRLDQPRLPVIFMSGYSETPSRHLNSPVSTLLKPFSMANLDQQIRVSLAAGAQLGANRSGGANPGGETPV